MGNPVALGALIGAGYATLRNRLGCRSFVSTLSGLLALLGLQLYMLGATGSINLPYGSKMVEFGQLMILPAWLSYTLALIPGIVMLVVGRSTNARRRAANLSAGSSSGLVLKAVLTTIALLAIVAYLSLGRGVPWMFALFVALVLAMNYALTRTQWGRSMKAVGGNAEAARRAGINVRAIYISAFALCSSLAALGGVLSAARLLLPSSSGPRCQSDRHRGSVIVSPPVWRTGSAFSARWGIIGSIHAWATLLNCLSLRT